MTFRRGFKSEAERLAEELRKQAGVASDSALQLGRLAELLNARLVSADTLVSVARLAELRAIQDDAFSACTFTFDGGSVVVFNPLNSKPRQASDIAHELAHLALNHSLRRTERVGPFAFFTCDPDQEAEANWLAGALLLPRVSVIRALRAGLGAQEIATQYNVSVQMATYRLNVTGAHRLFRS